MVVQVDFIPLLPSILLIIAIISINAYAIRNSSKPAINIMALLLCLLGIGLSLTTADYQVVIDSSTGEQSIIYYMYSPMRWISITLGALLLIQVITIIVSLSGEGEE